MTATVLLATSFPQSADDAAGHFVRTDAFERAQHGAVHVLTPAAGRMPGIVEERDPLGSSAKIVVERLPDRDLFGWPGAIARVRERPIRLLGAATFLRAATAALQRENQVGEHDRSVATTSDNRSGGTGPPMMPSRLRLGIR